MTGVCRLPDNHQRSLRNLIFLRGLSQGTYGTDKFLLILPGGLVDDGRRGVGGIAPRRQLLFHILQQAGGQEQHHGAAVGGHLAQLLPLGHGGAARPRPGGIDFATTEAKVILDAEGRPTDIALRRKTDATRLVEEAMILANETVAGYLERRGFPCLYRVHEPPASDALGSLIPVFQEFDWFEKPMEARLVAGDPKVIQEILTASAPRSEGELVSSLLLRAMKRADYRPENQGHYGLASEAYCHFTSPIRRYPDLVVHRMLRAALTRRPEKFDQEVAALPWIAEHSSAMERVAEAAARESQELKMVEYLAAFVGQSFSAVISGVAAWGLYVRLDCTAEGVLPVRALGDEYFVFDPVRYTLVGDESGKVYRLGQRVAVTLKSADATTASLEFVLAGRR